MPLIIDQPEITQFFVVASLDGSVVFEGQAGPGQATASAMPVASVSDDENSHLNNLAAYSDSFPALPGVGASLTQGELYEYGGSVVKVRQSHIRTIHDPADVPALFATYRVDGGNLDWIENENVAVGDIRIYNGQHYKCIQAHFTLSTWQPPNVPALWQVYIPPVTGEWQDSGETVTSLLGAGVIGVTDTAPFSADQLIRINSTEATVTSIFTAGAPGVLVISPHIAVTGGEAIEVFA